MIEDSSLRDQALGSLWIFANEVIFANPENGKKLEERPHREMIEYMEDGLQPNKLMLVPRDSLKSTIGSTIYPLWMVLRAYFLDNNPCYRVMIDSSTTGTSKKIVKNIAAWLKNHETLREVFGDLYTKKGDNQDGLSLSFRMDAASGVKEPNFYWSGIGAEKTGLHAELIIMDDLVTKDNVRTVAMREKTWEHYRMMQAILESDGDAQKTRQIIIGTRYGDDDMYGRIILQDKERLAEGHPPVFAPMIRAAVNEAGELFYPSRLTVDVLAKKRAVMRDLFWAQYMNDPNKEGAPFKSEQLKWHSLASFPRELNWIRLSADPAYKEEQKTHGDYSAIIVAGWDRWNALWILDVAMRNDLTPEKFIDLVFVMAKKWKIDSAIIENPHQEAMDILFRREMQTRQHSFPIFWEKPSRTRGKEMRWLDIQSYAERYAIKIADEISPDVKVEIMDEWERAPFARYDDFLDALQLQTMRLPIDVSRHGDDVPAEGRSVEEILDAGRSGGNTPYYGRLMDAFPFLAQIPTPERAVWEHDPIQDQIEATFAED